MQQGMNTLEIDRMAPQAQGIETLGSMEEVPMVPEGGIQAAVPDATRMLADAGRHGDIYVVHASEGETVVPKEVLEGPGGQQIRESLFRQMGQLGVDPERYVVGNELNSINPETGLPEFFFKKAFKKLKGFFKKAAPIILPIALNFLFPGLGTIAAGAIGSGIGTLIQGGSAKDALKAAAFGGITAGIMSGVSGAIGGQGFGAGVQSGLPSTMGGGSTVPFIGEGGGLGESPVSVFDAPGATTLPKANGTAFIDTPDATSIGTNVASTEPVTASLRTRGSGLTAKLPQPVPATQKPTGSLGEYLVNRQRLGATQPTTHINNYPQYAQKTPNAVVGSTLKRVSEPYDPTFLATNPNVAPADVSRGTAEKIVSSQAVQQAPPPGGIESITGSEEAGRLFPSSWYGRTEQQLLADRAGQYAQLSARIKNIPGLTEAERAIFFKAEAAKLAAGSNLSQYVGPLALAGGLAYAGGFFDEPEQEEFKSKFDPIPQSKIDPLRIDISPPPPPRAPIQFSAHGGEMQNFPPRIGAISGPGTGTSDDVPAMLSDGEFVMTAQAVRGAGNGSRRQGVQNLYNLMRNFEATV